MFLKSYLIYTADQGTQRQDLANTETMSDKKKEGEKVSHTPLHLHAARKVCFLLCEFTRAEHGLNLVNELLCNEVCKASHAHDSTIPLAGDALQTLVLLNLLKHVSDTNGAHIHAGITVHMDQHAQTQM